MTTSESGLARKILIVDDQKLALDVLKRLLVRCGFDVTTASNGKEALAAFEADRPDGVICDRRMPVMSGYALLRAIRDTYPECESMPFIFLTALEDRRDWHSVVDLRPTAYLTKPVDLDELLTTLNDCFEQPVPAAK